MKVVRPFYFVLQSVDLSDSAFITEGPILNTNIWYTSLLLVLDQITKVISDVLVLNFIKDRVTTLQCYWW